MTLHSPHHKKKASSSEQNNNQTDAHTTSKYINGKIHLSHRTN